MIEPARLQGGPEDGREVRVHVYGSLPALCYKVPCEPDVGAWLPEPECWRDVPIVGVYELALADMGLPSRADDGSLRYDWKGWR